MGSEMCIRDSHDDGQISELIVRKRIAAQGDGPRIDVELYKLEDLE